MAKQLAGEWEQIGRFNVETLIYDTLYYQFNETDGIVNEIVYGILTDSGKYEHVYSVTSQTLLRIDSVTQTAIHEFSFQTDSTGFLKHYNLEKGKAHLSDSKGNVFSMGFKIFIKDSVPFIQFDNPDSTKSIAQVKLSADRLELHWTEQVRETFKKLSNLQ
jgi:hypothetical protein